MHKWYQSQFADGEIRCRPSKDLSDTKVAVIDGQDAYGFTIYDWLSIRSPNKMKPPLPVSPDDQKESRFPIVGYVAHPHSVRAGRGHARDGRLEATTEHHGAALGCEEPCVGRAAVYFRLRKLPDQHPQCEGANKDRFLFELRGPVRDRRAFEAAVDADGTVNVEAGSLHGIVVGTQFVFAQQAFEDKQRRLIFAAVSVCLDSSILRPIAPVDDWVPLLHGT
ncbi:hypothetical protein MSAN_00917100 [Mycena sanguinolenta]|uniref:Uncharacterized protein n=1 Tax=Mycena sanguinolenta TaxID=230812 RepID=A0A8H7D8W7_9AGAR|nr:hypothetical protein MSAN_00917100 [Mycena sanguinolenta]